MPSQRSTDDWMRPWRRRRPDRIVVVTDEESWLLNVRFVIDRMTSVRDTSASTSTSANTSPTQPIRVDRLSAPLIRGNALGSNVAGSPGDDFRRWLDDLVVDRPDLLIWHDRIATPLAVAAFLRAARDVARRQWVVGEGLSDRDRLLMHSQGAEGTAATAAELWRMRHRLTAGLAIVDGCLD
ncbi:hypothetical protein [Crateriforma conspicua]|uniref:hypothetical protein n=1 Tax=Crateriforma conspicua TaxID=2527996 RepID=UPI0013FD062A|nr:hypothetical protein [Crateriforma conspicua]